MKKKFDDGGSVRTGGKYTASGDGPLEWQADVPVAATMGQVPVGMGSDIGRPDVVSRQLGPMSGGIGAGIGGLQDAAGRTETLMPFVAGNNEPGRLPIGAGLGGGQDVSRPMGLMVPSNVPRGLGSSIGTLGALRAAGMKKGGTVKKMAKGGSVSSASKRGDGCAVKGKTKGRFV